MPRRSSYHLVGCLCGLLLGGLLATGCTPDSSGSSAPPDTTTVSATTTSSAPTDPSAEPAAPPSGDDTRTVAERLDDASIAARVKQALVRPRTLRRFRFSPTVVRGHLTLRGDVDTQEQYRKAERIATNVEGVTEITNQVTVEGQAVSEGGDTSGTAYHTVQRGDTLTEIARAYDVSVQQLQALNDLSGSLQPGQRIRVR